MRKILSILLCLIATISYCQGHVKINSTGQNAKINSTGTKIDIVDADPDIPFDTTGATHKIVRAGGTIGVNCDYTTITDALAGITDNSISHQYILDVKNGTYNELGSFDVSFGIYVGITLKHYIHIIGESRTGVIVNGVQAASPSNEALVDAFHIPSSCLIQNMTINAQNCKYDFHCDYSAGNYEYDLYVKNCNVNHLGSVTQGSNAFGCGMWAGQGLTVINCTLTGDGFYAHGGTDCAQRNLAKHFNINLKNCSMNGLIWIDELEYAANKITLQSNTIGTIDLRTNTAIYDANPGNPSCNTGTMVYTTFSVSRNLVTTVTRDATTISILGSALSTPPDFY